MIDTFHPDDEEPPGSGPVDAADSEAPAALGRTRRACGPPQTTAAEKSGHVYRHGKILRLVGAEPNHNHVVSGRSRDFYRRHFPGTTRRDWNDWRWQFFNRITGVEKLASILELSPAEREILESHEGTVPFSVTPYYASLLNPADPDHPLRLSVVPRREETSSSEEDYSDPLYEHADSPVPCLVHRYPDRVLFLTTPVCSTYCRYCTRSRIVGGGPDGPLFTQWERALRYIEEHPEVRDVLLSGGDPLTLPNDRLQWLLDRLSKIPHVEIVRIGTKVPAVMPQRITPALVGMLKGHHPLFMSIHFTHPDELTPETAEACNRLADAGIPLGSQTVLLKGINDCAETLTGLFRGLLALRVRPYYLYQCDLVSGTKHFRTSIRQGLAIMDRIQGFTSGYAVPKYVVDAPEGGGKIPLFSNRIVSEEGRDVKLRNYEGRVFTYVDPE